MNAIEVKGRNFTFYVTTEKRNGEIYTFNPELKHIITDYEFRTPTIEEMENAITKTNGDVNLMERRILLRLAIEQLEEW